MMLATQREGGVEAPAMRDGADLDVIGVQKSYGDVPVLRGLDVTVPGGAFHALLGPSGSGKTTLLRAIAGFTPVDEGRVLIGGRDITQVSPERRNIGVVFQNYALFPHMTVAQNVGFGLRMRRRPRSEIKAKVAEVLDMVGLAGLQGRKPAALSGGQQQRVALARALVIDPDVLLLDEPLSALDRKIRQSVREELKRIQAQTGVTTIIVTHDQEEALFLADRIFLLDDGRIRQSGSPTEIYRRPADSFVAGFVGDLNRVRGTLEDRQGSLTLRVGSVAMDLPGAVIDVVVRGPGEEVEMQVRPEDVVVAAPDEPLPSESVPGTVTRMEFSGPVATVHVETGGANLRSLRLSPGVVDDPALRPGRPIRLFFNPGACRVVEAGAERAEAVTDEEEDR